MFPSALNFQTCNVYAVPLGLQMETAFISAWNHIPSVSVHSV